MSGIEITCAGQHFTVRPSGALHWPAEGALVVGDLHLGRAERLAREGASLLPPYETLDTLNRLEEEIAALGPRVVICLGDSFDDLKAADAMSHDLVLRIERLSAGRRWIWVAGNHDPGPVDLPGSHLAEHRIGPIVFRHIAEETLGANAALGEVSAHYHPKALLFRRGHRISRRCCLVDAHRVILSAFGTYTGGLDARDPAFDGLMNGSSVALLLGPRVTPVRRDRLG
ncbi:MAG: ligase-associated DNA damage response endonuclease PdeM [Pseudomonadota bacterium]